MRDLVMLGVVPALLLSAVQSAWAMEEEFAVRDGDTVVFLGDSITAEGTYARIIENYTLLRFPDRRVTFINAGVGGDTAEDGLKRLQHDVLRHRPTLVTVAFGINDIGWGTTADEEHRRRHLTAMRAIVKACVAQDIRVYVCSAAITGNNPDRGDSSFLQQMCDEAMQISRDNGGDSIDVQRGMRKIQRAAWEAAGDRSDEEKRRLLHTDDTIHLNELGQLAMAHAILKGLGAPADVSSVVLDAEQGTVLSADGCRISDVEKSDGGLAFVRTDEGLPFNYELFFERHYQFVPVPDTLNRYLLAVQRLPPGKYRVLAGGRDVGMFTSQQLEAGVNIASCTGRMWEPGGPWVAQAWVLKSLTDARHGTSSGLHQSQGWLDRATAEMRLSQEAAAVNRHLVLMQQEIVQPRPYQFSVQAIESAESSAETGD